jgi:hypothetical protein
VGIFAQKIAHLYPLALSERAFGYSLRETRRSNLCTFASNLPDKTFPTHPSGGRVNCKTICGDLCAKDSSSLPACSLGKSLWLFPSRDKTVKSVHFCIKSPRQNFSNSPVWRGFHVRFSRLKTRSHVVLYIEPGASLIISYLEKVRVQPLPSFTTFTPITS